MRKSTRSKCFDPETGAMLRRSEYDPCAYGQSIDPVSGAMLRRFEYRVGVRLPKGTFACAEDSQKKLLKGEKRSSMLWELATDPLTLLTVTIGVLVIAGEFL